MLNQNFVSSLYILILSHYCNITYVYLHYHFILVNTVLGSSIVLYISLHRPGGLEIKAGGAYHTVKN